MKANYNSTIEQLLREINALTSGLPRSTAHQIQNRVSKLYVLNRKAVPDKNPADDEVIKRIKAAIRADLMRGKKLDCRLGVDIYHTTKLSTRMSDIRADLKRENEGLILCDCWVKAEDGKRYKQYWIEFDEDHKNNLLNL